MQTDTDGSDRHSNILHKMETESTKHKLQTLSYKPGGKMKIGFHVFVVYTNTHCYNSELGRENWYLVKGIIF